MPVSGDKHHVLDPHTDVFVANINARLDADHHARFERRHDIARVVNINPNVV